jgi:hypothetical protein
LKTALQIIVLLLVGAGAYRLGYVAGGSSMYHALVAQYQTDRAGFETQIKALEALDRKIEDLKRVEAQAEPIER